MMRDQRGGEQQDRRWLVKILGTLEINLKKKELLGRHISPPFLKERLPNDQGNTGFTVVCITA